MQVDMAASCALEASTGMVVCLSESTGVETRRLQVTKDVKVDPGIQLSAKAGIAAGYKDVKPYQVAITQIDLEGNSLSFQYKIAVVGSLDKADVSNEEILAAMNAELQKRDSSVRVAGAKIKEAQTKQVQREVGKPSNFSVVLMPAMRGSSSESASLFEASNARTRGLWSLWFSFPVVFFLTPT